jgi:dTDP-4-dehydrorhamnose 3,5-epimerase-like enzyme
MVLSGSLKFVFVQPDNWTRPSESQPYNEYLLKEENNEIIHVPSGYANGFKALEPNSKLMVFSDTFVEESKEDDFRIDHHLCYNWLK